MVLFVVWTQKQGAGEVAIWHGPPFSNTKKLLNLLELAKGNHNYFQIEKKPQISFPSPYRPFSYPKLHIFNFITQQNGRSNSMLSILKFFPTLEPVAPTGLLFQYHDYFIIALWFSYQLFFRVKIHNWEQIYYSLQLSSRNS